MAYQDKLAWCACPLRCATFVRTFSQRTRRYAVGCPWYAEETAKGKASRRKEAHARRVAGEPPRKRGPKPRPGIAGAETVRHKQCQTCFDQGHRRESPKCRGCDREPSPDVSLTKASARGIQYATTELVVDIQGEENDHDESIDEGSLLDADGHFRVGVRRPKRRYGPRRERGCG